MSSELSEPVIKKPKLYSAIDQINESILKMKSKETNLIPIINDEMYQPILLVKAIVGTIINNKDISKTIVTLNQKIPLKELQHLKRVQKNRIIICTKDSLLDKTVKEHISNLASDIVDVFENFEEIDVPSLAPKVRKQFDVANKVWACNFHPNKYNEKLVSGNFFSEPELIVHKQFMEITFEVAKFYLEKSGYEDVNLEEINAGVVVDPTTQSVVAISYDNRDKHPMQHTAMLAIDNVAKTQNGGAWIDDKEKFYSTDTMLRGMEEDFQLFIKQKFPDVKIGAKPFKSKRDGDMSMNDSSDDTGPYLCTGYYIYLLKEPCVMCSMALVHARVKRIFFCYDNLKSGGLKSRTKLQTVSSLNHHFEVFSGFL